MGSSLMIKKLIFFIKMEIIEKEGEESMEYNVKEIKKGIKMHYIKTDLFKTDLISIFLTRKLDRETVTKYTLIPAVLTSGTKTMPTQ